MTRDELEQAQAIRGELRTIEESLSHPKSIYVAAYYKDYSSGVGVPRVETGEDGGRNERIKLEIEYERKKGELRKLAKRIEDFISELEDSDIRTILRGLYINGMSQAEVGQMLNIDQSIVSRRLKKFWENMES